MNIQLMRDILKWCSIINCGLLLFWFLLFMLAHDWMIHFYGRWFRLSADQFDAINFAELVFFKIGIILFNLVPLAALYIVQ
jgi:hypothetical protein